MSDAITELRRNQDMWDTARKYACMYFGKIPIKEGITKEEIELWITKHNRTPESLKEELEKLGLYWWF